MLIDGDQVEATRMDVENRMKSEASELRALCDAIEAGEYDKGQAVAEKAQAEAVSHG